METGEEKRCNWEEMLNHININYFDGKQKVDETKFVAGPIQRRLDNRTVELEMRISNHS